MNGKTTEIFLKLFIFLFAGITLSSGQTCGHGNITEICCNDIGCCWSSNETIYAPIGCFNITELMETTTQEMTTMVTTSTVATVTQTLTPTTTASTATKSTATTTVATAATITTTIGSTISVTTATTVTLILNTSLPISNVTLANTNVTSFQIQHSTTQQMTTAATTIVTTIVGGGSAGSGGSSGGGGNTAGGVVDQATTAQATQVSTIDPQQVTPLDTYIDPVFSCYTLHKEVTYSEGMIYLIGSFTPQTCFEHCNNTFNCLAFQLSRSGGDKCGIFKQTLEPSLFKPFQPTSVYTFDSVNCVKPDFTSSCSYIQWSEATYKCSNGLVMIEDINTEAACQSYCACNADDCVASVVRNGSSSFECYIVKGNSEYSNYHMCSRSVKQFTSLNYTNADNKTGSKDDTTSGGTNSINATYTEEKKMGCWKPPIVANSRVQLHKDQYGIAAIYTCNNGYYFPSGEQTRSLLCIDYQWGTLIPYCKPIECIVPRQKVAYGQTLVKTCDIYEKNIENFGPRLDEKYYDDYKNYLDYHVGAYEFPRSSMPLPYPFGGGFENSYVYQGSKNKYFRWGDKKEILLCSVSNSMPLLLPSPSRCNYKCQAPLLVSNTTVRFFPDDAYAIYKCVKGHRFPNGKAEKKVSCNEDGKWPDIEACSVLFCEVFPTDERRNLSSSDLLYGTITVASCIEGYIYPQKQTHITLECQESFINNIITAAWNDTMKICEEVLCSRPYLHPSSEVTNEDITQFAFKRYPYRTSINYKCRDALLKFDDGRRSRDLVCDTDQNWSYETVDCAANRCDPLMNVPHSTTDNFKATKGSNVTYTCLPGYWFDVGVKQQWAVCDGSSWTKLTYASCADIVCPTKIENGRSNITETMSKYLSYIKVTCDPGYRIINEEGKEAKSATANCTVQGSWSIPVDCYPVDCGSPKLLEKSVIDEDEVNTIYNTNLKYQCVEGNWFGRDGYQLVSRCNEDGQWSVDNNTNVEQWRQCEEIKCLPLINIFSAENTTHTVNSKVNISCKEDQRFEGVVDQWVVSYCDEMGNWNPSIPHCIDKSKIVTLKVNESPEGNLIASISISIIAIQVIVMFLLDIPMWKKSLCYMRDNIRDRFKK